MKVFRYIASGVLVCAGVLGAAVYSSCSKNECGAVTCLNKSSCVQGLCQCPKGVFGTNCEKIYAKEYSGQYKGLPPGFSASDTTNTLLFEMTDDTTDYNKMDMLWIDSSGATKAKVPIVMSNHTTSGSSFVITTTTLNSVVYSGNGTISNNVANLRMKATDAANDTVYTIYVFNNYIR